MFADVSGFTAISEQLGAAGRTGSEELTVILNQYFEPMIELLHSYGGIVGKFGGDAMTVVFPCGSTDFVDVARRSVQCAWEMQAKMADYAAIETRAGTFSLAMKVGIAAGPILATVVGDREVRLEYVLAGSALDKCADAEHHAERDEIVVCADVATAVSGYAQLEERGEFFRVNQWRKQVSAAPLPDLGPLPVETLDTISVFMHPSIAQRLRRDQLSFINEHRRVTILFVSFAGFDYDQDITVTRKLQSYFAKVIEIVYRYDGYLNKIDMGDKGSKFIILFGTPISHEDDEDRALRCALALRAMEEMPVRVGVNTGSVYCGHVGSDLRREYTVMGDAVNLAARLMQAAGQDEVLVGAATQLAEPAPFIWEQRPPLRVKGKQEPVDMAALTGLKQVNTIRLQEPKYVLPMVGRQDDLTAVSQSLKKAWLEQGQIIGITAEAGMGKSRFAAEVIKLATKQGLIGYGGECLSHGTKTSYLVWQNLLRGLLGVKAGWPLPVQTAHIENKLKAIDPGLAARLPLLSLPLNIAIPDNDLTAQMDAKLRKASLEALLVDVVRHEAGKRPLFLVLEDCHWIDPLSRDLLTIVGRNIRDLPALILVIYRPLDAFQAQLPVSQMSHFNLIALQEFTPQEANRLISLKMKRFFGEKAKVSADMIGRITERAGGNPFYIDELVNLLRDRGVNPNDTEALDKIDLPDSLQSLIISRLDQLAEEPKTTLKVASVIGRLFKANWLWHIYPKLGEPEQVLSQLELLNRLDITPLDQGVNEEVEYLFKHILTREVAYESLALATRTMLHEQIGKYIERHFPDNLDQYLDLLAYHYGLSQNQARQRHYFRRAAVASRQAFANDAAIAYFNRLLPLLDGRERAEVLLELGQVYLLVGQWDDAEAAYQQALAISEEMVAPDLLTDCYKLIGVLLRNQGKYEDSLEWLGRAKAQCERYGDAGDLGDINREIGVVYWSHGRYDTSLIFFAKSMEIAQETGDEKNRYRTLGNIGLVNWSQGKTDEALDNYLKYYNFAVDQGDKLTISLIMGNIGAIYQGEGDYKAALHWFTQNLNLAIELGYRQGVNIAIGNIGIIYFENLKRLSEAEHIFT
ncbi:MAG: tetratricopeptide repeat protein, partial [Anaerolineae bacterium]